MRIDVTQGIKDYEGNFTMTNKMENGRPVLDGESRPIQIIEQVRAYFINALNGQLPGETLVAEDKAQIYYLSVKLFRGKEVDLTVSDQKFILDRVGKIYGPLVYGRIMDLFEGKAEDQEAAKDKEPAKKSATEN
jgi:hypothetical protein